MSENIVYHLGHKKALLEALKLVHDELVNPASVTDLEVFENYDSKGEPVKVRPAQPFARINAKGAYWPGGAGYSFEIEIPGQFKPVGGKMELSIPAQLNEQGWPTSGHVTREARQYARRQIALLAEGVKKVQG